jgi:rubredoxin
MSFAQRLNRALSYGEVYWYCPQCHAEVLGTDADAHRYYRRGEDTTAARLNPDARMAYDPYSETWHCPLCDLTLSDTEDDRSPIPSLRIYADLFRPVYDRLTLEHADDRAGILNHIDDQKRQYRNEEFKQLSDFHERHGRELSSIEDSLTELLAEIQADQTAIGSYVALAAKYDRMQQARADAYVRDCQRIRAEIEADARATADRISEYSDQLLEQAHVEAERRALLQNQIEECRHQELVGAVQHVAANTATMVHEQRRTNAYLRLMAPKRRFRVRWL